MATKTESANSLRNAPSTPVDEILKETEVGVFIAKYKGPLLIVTVLIIVSVIAWGIYSNQVNNVNAKSSDLVYGFEKSTMSAYQEGKVSDSELLQKTKELQQQVKNFDGALPTFIKVSSLLQSKGKSDEALTVLDGVEDNLGRNAFYSRYFLYNQLAALYEDKGDFDHAIAYSEKLRALPVKSLEGKVYLDLGRLYLKKGDKEKAKSSLQYIIDNQSDPELTKLAKIYMERL